MDEESKRKRQFKRQNEHTKETKDRFQACFDKGTLARIREKIGEKASINAYVCKLVYADLDGDQLQRSEDQEEPTEKTPEERAAELTEQARREKEETARREREELENAKPAEIRQSGELNKARQALKLEKIRKEEEENREKMNDQQRLAQAFIDQARKAEEEATEEAEK